MQRHGEAHRAERAIDVLLSGVPEVKATFGRAALASVGGGRS
jgi:hypothetical protein